MHSTLLYIDPENSECRQLVQLAADLVEALTFQYKEFAKCQLIGVVAEPSVCLEIGLSMLGRGDTRTVEGGKRQQSPLMLFPFIATSNEAETEFNLIGGFKKQHKERNDEFGTLDDLATFGAVEQDDESFSHEWNDMQSRNVLERALHRREWQNVLVFGAKELDCEHNALLEQYDIQVERVQIHHQDNERLHTLFKRLEPVKNEGIYEAQMVAVASALHFEDLLNRFEMKE